MATLVVAAFGLWSPLVRRQQTQLAECLAAQALQYEDGRSEAAIERIVDLGAPGMASLVRLAASHGPVAAPTARRRVLDELSRCEIAAEAGATSGLVECMTGLAGPLARCAHENEFDAIGQCWAQHISRRIARHCDRLPAQDAAPLLAACGAVLEAPPVAAMSAGPTTSDWLKRWGEWRAAALSAVQPASPRDGSNLDAAKPPAAEAVEAPARTSVDIAAAPATEMWLLPAGEERPGLDVDSIDGPLSANLPLERSLDPDANVLIDVPGPDEIWRNLRRYRAQSDRDLVRQLDSAPMFEGHAIRRVLWERGLTKRELDLIRELESQSPAERRDGLDRISSLAAAPARRLLRWFVADRDPTTRLKALTLLATSGDPQLAALAQERVMKDDDPRVAELAQRIIREQR